MQNMLLKTPYKFKKLYDGTPEPHTAQDAHWLHEPSLKSYGYFTLHTKGFKLLPYATTPVPPCAGIEQRSRLLAIARCATHGGY